MTALLKLYVVSIVAFLAFAAVWLRLVAGKFYRVQSGALLQPDARWATISAAVATIGCRATDRLGVA